MDSDDSNVLAEAQASEHSEEHSSSIVGTPVYQEFIHSLSYLPFEEIELVKKAFCFGEDAHQGQKRLSGEHYITHPLAVASTLAEWRMDTPAVIAALLHDVVEDTGVTKNDLAEVFGKQVAELVDGVSKLDKIETQSYSVAQAENFRKMMMSMARDLRVVLIKLADRYHNIRTMGPFRAEKRKRIAQETLEIYVPIATRLGLDNLSRQLQDLSFMHIHPMRFQVLARALKAVRGNRRELLSKILEGLRTRLREENIDAGVFGREKSLYSIYRKMVDKQFSFAQVLDIYGFRIIVRDVATCYLALGALHNFYKPIPGKFKDYIALPKINGYQSLHTMLIGPYGTPVEIQIRTQSMHHLAEEGIASHWLYKDDEESGAELQSKTHQWLQSLLETEENDGDSSAFLEHVKGDLFSEEVYVFTPKGKILTFPRGATVIDFAYAVHTDVGHRCIAARIDHELLPLSSLLLNGSQIEILTSLSANPNPEWLNHVKTGRARNKIRQFLKMSQQEGSSGLGENMLNSELQSLGVVPSDIPDNVWDDIIRDSDVASKEKLFADIGLGRSLPSVLAHKLAERDDVAQSETTTVAPVIIRNVDEVSIHLAHCCRPIPKVPIVGEICAERGLIIHTSTCQKAKKDREVHTQNWIPVEWAPEVDQLFETRIKVTTKNVPGALGRIATAISAVNANIQEIEMRNNPGLYSELHFLLQVSNRTHLAVLMRNLRRIPDVEHIARERD